MQRRPRGLLADRRPRVLAASPITVLPAALCLVSLCLAGCGSSPATITIAPGSAVSSASGASSSASGSSPTAALGLPSPVLSPGGSGDTGGGTNTSPSQPAASTSPSASAPRGVPDATPNPPLASATPLPSGSGGSGGSEAACTGTAENQAFFASVAAGVSWTVYCAVLPSGWYLQQGAYQLDGGGQMTVTYKGPGDVHLQLQEGAFCSGGADACAPHDTVIGPTAFGDRDGQLMGLTPGYAVYVSPGDPPSWAAASVDLDEATFVRLVAALHAVGA
ncbi:MAG TPA: hypothetical protein VFW92_10020 [Candidatus Limnocylindrales bacterium]|nr:hypothetical protein [Candidatus Limnocylindrales bacterium]